MRILVAGALGEVGSSISRSLIGLGHEVVPVSSRADLPDVKAIGFGRAVEMIESGEADFVMNAAGRGDRRPGDRSGRDATSALAPAIAAAGVAAVLLSTTRVLEGYEGDCREDEPPRPRTPYAVANTENESAWLDAAGHLSSVLRITNFFCAPQTGDSPQSLLLPWSLVTEALESGAIAVRSGPLTTREFVSAQDVARAALTLSTGVPSSRICATGPGFVATLQDLVLAVQAAFDQVGLPVPTAAFGLDSTSPPVCEAKWLTSQGWRSSLSDLDVTNVVATWLRDKRLD